MLQRMLAHQQQLPHNTQTNKGVLHMSKENLETMLDALISGNTEAASAALREHLTTKVRATIFEKEEDEKEGECDDKKAEKKAEKKADKKDD